MAQCVSCGEKAGAFKSECRSCEAKRLESERALHAEQARQQADAAQRRAAEEARALEERTVAYIDESIEGMRRTLDEGRTPYLFSSVYLTSQYSLLEQEGGAPPDVHDLAILGRDGWEVVTAIPQTAGIGLSNVYQKGGGKTWGGGIGGIVTGVFLLIRLTVTRQTLESQMDVIRATLRQQYEDGRSMTASSVIVPGVQSGSVRGGGGISPLAGVALGAVGMSLMTDAFTSFDAGGGDGGGGDTGFDGGDFEF